MVASINNQEGWEGHGREREGKKLSRVSAFTAGSTLVETFPNDGSGFVALIYPGDIDTYLERIADDRGVSPASVFIKYRFADGEYHLDQSVSSENIALEEGVAVVDFVEQGMLHIRPHVTEDEMTAHLDGQEPIFRLAAYAA